MLYNVECIGEVCCGYMGVCCGCVEVVVDVWVCGGSVYSVLCE